MSHADTFARFVARLADYLDEPGAVEPRGGRAFAAALFLSRSQLDRIVAAVAGETAGHFRRRVLLERAAYRLRTTGAGVLDVAVEAGFGSAEAFSRAFRRAYGQTPSRWRTTAAGFSLPSPNGVHFHPPGGLRLPASPGGAMSGFVPGLIDHHLAVVGRLLDRAATLPDERLDAPIEAGGGFDPDPTIRSLLSRLVGQLETWSAAMANVPFDPTPPPGERLDALRSRLDRSGPAFARAVRDVDGAGRYGETYVDTTTGRPYVFTAAGMIGHVLTYAAYRRTVVAGALAAAGAGDVDDDPLHWFS